jgi:prepilin-type processing-associated H-X9-DG protein
MHQCQKTTNNWMSFPSEPTKGSKMKKGHFTKIELLVVIAIVVVLASFLALRLSHSKQQRSRIGCASKLERIGMAFIRYEQDNGGNFPMSVARDSGGTRETVQSPQGVFRHFQVLSNDLGETSFLICPQDNRDPARLWGTMFNSNVSYFIALDAKGLDGKNILSGDRNISAHPESIQKLVANSGWNGTGGLHGIKGHILFSDGHVEFTDEESLRNAIQNGGNNTNRIAIP